MALEMTESPLDKIIPREDAIRILRKIARKIQNHQSLQEIYTLVVILRNCWVLSRKNSKEKSLAINYLFEEVNGKLQGDYTILHHAFIMISKENIRTMSEIVTCLLEEKAHPGVKNSANITPFYCFLTRYVLKILDADRREGLDLFQEIVFKYPSCLKSTRMGHMPGKVTALHCAVIWNNFSLFIALVANGADLHAMNAKKETPIDLAKNQWGEDSEFFQKIQTLRKNRT